jgi:hypothetical protein
MVTLITGLAMSLITALAIALVSILIKEIENQQKPTRQPNSYKTTSTHRTRLPPLNPVTHLPSASNPLKLPKLSKHSTLEVFESTEKRLYSLVGGNKKTATRLLESVRDRNPGRSEQWIWEKVIYDLERDRRA